MYTPLSLTLILALTSLNVQAAGPHQHGRKLATHRRHHARAVAAAERGEKAPSSTSSFALPLARDEDNTTTSDSCTLGAWKCSGTELHRCYNDQWNFITNCTGTDIVCSDALYTTGCVWTWDVESAATASATASSGSGSINTSETSALESATVTSTIDPTVTATATSSASTATTTDDGSEECDDDDDDDSDDDGEDETCEDEDEDDADEDTCDDDDGTTTASASVITAGSTTESASAVPVMATASTTTDSISAVTESETASTTTVMTSVATATSAIGDGLFADGGDGDASSTATSATRSGKTRSYGRHKTTSTSVGGSEATQTSTSYDDGSTFTASNTADSTDGVLTASSTTTSTDDNFTASATVTSDDSYNMTSSSSSAGYTDVTQTSTSGRQQSTTINSAPAGVANATIAASGRPGVTATTVTTSAKTYAPTVTSSSNTTTSNTWSAPHWVIYADEWLYSMPSVSDLSEFNRFILAFWMSDSGAVDDAEAWEGFDASTRASVLEEYHNAGIALMVSAFGSTDKPTSNGADAKQTAQDLAAWVKKYDLDGVDIDYEDMDAMNSAKAVSWIVEFQAELRSLLPSPYIISHAPVAPWFTSASDYSDGAYVAIDQQVGDGIDWYNVQFYNQGSDQYTTCETLITNSGTNWPSTSVLEINSYAGVDLDKIVIGKPLDSGAADNGYMDAATIHQCVEIAKESGWNAGVMFWEWTDQAPSIMSSVRGGD